MTIYRIGSRENYLEVLADFILKNFATDITELKIILPNGISCLWLQWILLSKLKTGFLPKIVPLANLVAEGEEVYKIPSEDINTLSPFEEQIVLAKIITNHPELGFSLNQALKFSSSLSSFFAEITKKQVDIKEIADIADLEAAEHWQMIYHFLSSSYKEWQEEVRKTGKLSKANFQLNMISAETSQLHTEDKPVIVAGILANDSATKEFLRQVAKSEKHHLILPPFPLLDNMPDEIKFSSSHPLYLLGTFLSELKITAAEVKSLTNNKDGEQDIFNSLISSVGSTRSHKGDVDQNIRFFEFDDLFQEAEGLSLMCRDHLLVDKKQKIAFIVNDETYLDIYNHFLSKYALEFHSFFGRKLVKTNVMELIFQVSDCLTKGFSLQTLINLLKNPLIICEEAHLLEQSLRSKDRFLNSMQGLKNFILAQDNSPLKDWFERICWSLEADNLPFEFESMLQFILTRAEIICASIWQSEDGRIIADFLAEVLNNKIGITFAHHEEFTELLRNLLSRARIFDPVNDTANIYLCKPKDAALLKFDLVILADLNEGNWPKHQTLSPWMNKQMLAKLGLDEANIRAGEDLYNFYLLLQGNYVILSRARKIKGSVLTPSTYFEQAEFLYKKYTDNREKETLPLLLKEAYSPNHHDLSGDSQDITSDYFPLIISATDVERLIRSPYNFYAKKILKLKKLDEISSEVKLSEFGNFVHKAFELYTKSYSLIDNDHYEFLSEIARNLLANHEIPKVVHNSWQLKFAEIAKDFIKFDEVRRSGGAKVYSELAGEMTLNINNSQVKIIAIADRIEVKNHKATILDFKTGAVPTKKDVEIGLAPQLLIEAMMLLEGGFPGIIVSELEELVYVKIASSKPYIETTEIKISQAELQCHKQGLINLLENYLRYKKFSKEINLLKYDDFKHLARKE